MCRVEVHVLWCPIELAPLDTHMRAWKRKGCHQTEHAVLLIAHQSIY